MVRALPETAKQPKEMILAIYGSFAFTVFTLTGDWKWEKRTNGKELPKVLF